MRQIKNPLPNVRTRIAYREEFTHAIEPFWRMRLRLRMMAIPRWQLRDGELYQIDDGLTPAMRELDTSIEETIAQIKSTFEKRFKEKFRVS